MPDRKRAIRIANCSADPGSHMYDQAKYGPVDVITGDYLAEVNLANNAEAMAQGNHPGWVPTALDGLRQTLAIAQEKKIKIVINGGGLNPKGLAEKTHEIALSLGLSTKVAYVDGDDLMDNAVELLSKIKTKKLTHFDSINSNVQLEKDTLAFLEHSESMPIVSANAYLGYRAIRKGLDEGADVIICGRVADASPVIGTAAWWHQWKEDEYHKLAGSLIAGHLIECSTNVTGANFAGFFRYKTKQLLNLALPIAEIDSLGHCVITKHEALPGLVTADTVKCQLLYELQGNIYLNSDVKADITGVQIIEEGPNRVTVFGVSGHPPPPTTKLAVFYRAGYQREMLLNGNGYAIDKKYDLHEAQLKSKLDEWGAAKNLDVLKFQRAWYSNGMAHFAGMHCSLDMRTVAPKPFLGFYPATIEQSELDEAVTFLGEQQRRLPVGPPKDTEALAPRENYETHQPIPLDEFGPTEMRPLGDIVLGRSGDKGANVNLGLFVQDGEQWEWFRSFMTRARIQQLMGEDWREWYFVERVEMPNIYAVHFVIYGPLGRGVSSSKLLDSLGKGFGEFIRAVHVPLPTKFLKA